MRDTLAVGGGGGLTRHIQFNLLYTVGYVVTNPLFFPIKQSVSYHYGILWYVIIYAQKNSKLIEPSVCKHAFNVCMDGWMDGWIIRTHMRMYDTQYPQPLMYLRDKQ